MKSEDYDSILNQLYAFSNLDFFDYNTFRCLGLFTDAVKCEQRASKMTEEENGTDNRAPLD